MAQSAERNPKNASSPLSSSGLSSSGLSSKEWSVDDFYELRRQRLFGTDEIVELVAGEICRLPPGEGLERQIKLLQYQIQKHLNMWGAVPYEVRSRHPIKINQYSELKPAITVIAGAIGANQPGRASQIQWVIDIADEGLNQAHTRRSQLFAQADIADYWSMTVSQAELRTYQGPTAQGYQEGYQKGYQQCKLWQVGDRATPTMLPQITLQLQEPVPISFLTRTLGGQSTYPSDSLPLQVCPPAYS